MKFGEKSMHLDANTGRPYIEVWGTYNPKRTDDLIEEAKQYIGQKFKWRYMWIIEDENEEYKGQYAMMTDYNEHKLYFGWSPECDVDIVEESGGDGE